MLNFKFKTKNSEFTTNQPINFFDFDLQPLTSFPPQSTPNSQPNQLIDEKPINPTRLNHHCDLNEPNYLNHLNNPTNIYIGKTANITVLQIEWEIITGARFLKRQYMAPQKAPATPAAPISIKLNDHMWTPA
jgi:hypothetical protein